MSPEDVSASSAGSQERSRRPAPAGRIQRSPANSGGVWSRMIPTGSEQGDVFFAKSSARAEKTAGPSALSSTRWLHAPSSRAVRGRSSWRKAASMSSWVSASPPELHHWLRHSRSNATLGRYFAWSASCSGPIQLAIASGNSENTQLGSCSAVSRSFRWNVLAWPAFMRAKTTAFLRLPAAEYIAVHSSSPLGGQCVTSSMTNRSQSFHPKADDTSLVVK